MHKHTRSTMTNDSSTSSITFEGLSAAMDEFRAECPKPLPRRIYVASDIWGACVRLRADPMHAPLLDGIEIVESPLMPAGKWIKDSDLPNLNRIDWVQQAPFMRDTAS